MKQFQIWGHDPRGLDLGCCYKYITTFYYESKIRPIEEDWDFDDVYENIKSRLLCTNCNNYILSSMEIALLKNVEVLSGINGIKNLLKELSFEEV